MVGDKMDLTKSRREELLSNYYGLSLDFIDLDELFDSQPEAVLINNLVLESGSQEEAAAVFSKLIKTEVSGSNFVSTPKCHCGRLHTQYDADVGNVCSVCKTVCVKQLHRDIQERSWIAAVHPVESFIHPTFWRLFVEAFGSCALNKTQPMKGYDLLAWLTDPYYSAEKVSLPNLNMQKFFIEEVGFTRGFNNFIRDFDRIMDILLDKQTYFKIQIKILKRDAKAPGRLEAIEEERLDWIEFLQNHRHKLFPSKLPLISDQMIVTEESNKTKQIEPAFLSIIDAAKTVMSAVNVPPGRNRVRLVVSRMTMANRLHALFNYEFRRDIMFPKSGIIRSKNNRTRASYSGRATISALPGGHMYDECITPWRWTVNLLYLHISNKLIHKYEKTPIETIRILDQALVTYSKFVHSIIRELIDESPDKGIMIVPLRNPTLVRLSVWVLYITDVKVDVNDGSISISNLIIKQANADYDGDQIMVQMPTDNMMRIYARNFSAALSIMSRVKPNKVSGKLTLHPENIENQYLFIKETVLDNEWD